MKRKTFASSDESDDRYVLNFDNSKYFPESKNAKVEYK